MLNKSILIFSLYIFCFGNAGNSQKISIEEYKIILNNVKPPCHDTLTEFTRDNKKIVIHLLDCMGQMDIKVYKGGKLIEEGCYVKSLDTLKRYVYKNALGGGGKEITVGQYFQPLRNGVWIFYNQKGQVLKRVTYLNGIQVE